MNPNRTPQTPEFDPCSTVHGKARIGSCANTTADRNNENRKKRGGATAARVGAGRMFWAVIVLVLTARGTKLVCDCPESKIRLLPATRTKRALRSSAAMV
mmetsp:Transcript_13585/g.29431  ORF Transcript_13585/g.29431 Transcript_13585/m.29431 type:complete len:100 (-) Transcript_13585:341-640(-)